MFRITPEAFNAVARGSPLGSASLFSDHDMVASDGKGTIGMPVVGVVEAARPRVCADKSDHLAAASSLDRGIP
jgi:hypothetical protein